MSVDLLTTVKYMTQLLWCILPGPKRELGVRKEKGDFMTLHLQGWHVGANATFSIRLFTIVLRSWPLLAKRTDNCRNDDDLMIRNLISRRVKLSIFPLHNRCVAECEGNFMFDSVNKRRASVVMSQFVLFVSVCVAKCATIYCCETREDSFNRLI